MDSYVFFTCWDIDNPNRTHYLINILYTYDTQAQKNGHRRFFPFFCPVYPPVKSSLLHVYDD